MGQNVPSKVCICGIAMLVIVGISLALLSTLASEPPQKQITTAEKYSLWKQPSVTEAMSSYLHTKFHPNLSSRFSVKE
ncbi:hypothetical protein MSG28_005281 [Choristoneura fumiferana]|uniref:Uncharacterized protein n=1 Tax=Choristoneura fumiferana TaxID=7141 RepID=A0ACC0JQL6_CHOFU|nr:hypothetical protein MSG28_005281 [Choristoneura fumiferana]